MLQLTYISSARPGDPVDVEAILRVSRRNNAAGGITGLLLYDGRRFLQALEGEAAAVESAFDRIRADPRHRAVVILSRREVVVREFGEWAMASHAAGAGLVDAVDSLTTAVPDANTRELFRSFARIVRQAA